jgi:ABC-type antimicrobial peptide transport system permease subunit
VEAAGVVQTVPLNSQQTNGTRLRTDLGQQFDVSYRNNNVGADYFRAMSIPILAGREFLPSDRAGAPAVAVINENFARYLFPGVNPVGHSIRFPEGTPVTIVGVAKNSKYFTLGEVNVLALYSPYAQQRAGDNLNFLIRAAAPRALVKPVTRILGRLDASAAIETKPMRNALVLALLPSRAGAAILGSVGVLGLVLASIGLYGVLAYAVSRRIREIGLRVALGAEPRTILRMVFGNSLELVAIGAGIGLAISVMVTKPLVMFLVPGLSPADPWALLAAVALLGVVALAATIGPALRALRVDPMVALRYE